MKLMEAAEFEARCLEILDRVPPEGILISRDGKALAVLLEPDAPRSHAHFIGILPGQGARGPERQPLLDWRLGIG